MKILLVGADGQLGTDLGKVLDPKGVIPLTVSDLDITNHKSVNDVISKRSPEVIINTAAYHNVDLCEKEVERAFDVNTLGPKCLAEAAKSADAKLVHISTDYVFDGEKGSAYSENDVPNPKSAYGISKLAGELFVKYVMEKHFIIRASSLFGVAGCLGKGGGNFVEGMIKRGREKGEAKVVTDQVSSPTYTLDLARKISDLIKTDHFGLYHVTNKGECSWYDFAKKIFELAGIKVKLGKTTSSEWKAPAHRPKYSVLKHQKLIDLGMDDMPHWEDALKAYLIEKGHVKEN
jgi:dTDP-4-dehydrorhamnose reductase